jgi:hypothetical protein
MNPRKWSADLRFVVALFVAVRVFLFAWGLVATAALPVDRRFSSGHYLPPGHILEPWQRWDTVTFIKLAVEGYTSSAHPMLTPPLYPTMIWFITAPLGGDIVTAAWAAMLIANVFGFFALLHVYRLTRFELGSDADARRAVLYLTVFPTGYYLFAAYTDPIFLAGAAGCLYYARQRRWGWAAFWGTLGAMSRMVGAVLLVPVAWEAWQQWRAHAAPRPVPWSSLACLAAMVAGVAVLPLYTVLVLGMSPLEPAYTQVERYRSTFVIPGTSLLAAIGQVFTDIQSVSLAGWTDLLLTLLFIALLVPVWRRLPKVYGVYHTTLLLGYLVVQNALYPLKAQSRYMLGLFPGFLILAMLGRRRAADRVIFTVSVFAWLLLSGQFFIGGWVA